MDITILKELISLVNQGYRWEVLDKDSYMHLLKKRHELMLGYDADTIFVRFVNGNHIFWKIQYYQFLLLIRKKQ